MKRALTIILAGIIAITATATPASAAVEGITKDNYSEWVKIYPDAPGYNKGECDREYLEGEEFFYDEYTDHWNVDRVYDENLIQKAATENMTKAKAVKGKKAHAKKTKKNSKKSKKGAKKAKK